LLQTALRELAERSPNEEIRNQAKETWHFLIDTNSTPVTSEESSRPCDLASAAAVDETKDDKYLLLHNEESKQINE
jgi:hypothetical protein